MNHVMNHESRLEYETRVANGRFGPVQYRETFVLHGAGCNSRPQSANRNRVSEAVLRRTTADTTTKLKKQFSFRFFLRDF